MPNKNVICENMDNEDHAAFDALADSTEPVNLLEKARTFATAAHDGQMRKDKKNPYIVHPERVVKLLKAAGVTDQEVLAAAYLHDVLEDTKETIDGKFSDRVVGLVKELSKPPGLKDKNTYLAGFSHKSPDAVLIKLADRLDNLTDGLATMGPDWVQNYLKGADALLLAARRNGINKLAPGAKLFGWLTTLRDRLSKQVSPPVAAPASPSAD